MWELGTKFLWGPLPSALKAKIESRGFDYGGNPTR